MRDLEAKRLMARSEELLAHADRAVRTAADLGEFVAWLKSESERATSMAREAEALHLKTRSASRSANPED